MVLSGLHGVIVVAVRLCDNPFRCAAQPEGASARSRSPSRFAGIPPTCAFRRLVRPGRDAARGTAENFLEAAGREGQGKRPIATLVEHDGCPAQPGAHREFLHRDALGFPELDEVFRQPRRFLAHGRSISHHEHVVSDLAHKCAGQASDRSERGAWTAPCPGRAIEPGDRRHMSTREHEKRRSGHPLVNAKGRLHGPGHHRCAQARPGVPRGGPGGRLEALVSLTIRGNAVRRGTPDRTAAEPVESAHPRG